MTRWKAEKAKKLGISHQLVGYLEGNHEMERLSDSDILDLVRFFPPEGPTTKDPGAQSVGRAE